jgi:hypothetical protein
MHSPSPSDSEPGATDSREEAMRWAARTASRRRRRPPPGPSPAAPRRAAQRGAGGPSQRLGTGSGPPTTRARHRRPAAGRRSCSPFVERPRQQCGGVEDDTTRADHASGTASCGPVAKRRLRRCRPSTRPRTIQ